MMTIKRLRLIGALSTFVMIIINGHYLLPKRPVSKVNEVVAEMPWINIKFSSYR